MSFRYLIVLSLLGCESPSPDLRLAGVAQPPPGPLSTWSWSGSGEGLGAQLFEVVNLDGVPTLVTGSQVSAFGTNTLASEWVSNGAGGLSHGRSSRQLRHGGSSLVRAVVGQVTGDPDPELIAVYEDGQVDIHDAISGVVVGGFASGQDPVGLLAQDIDGDGTVEIIVADYTSTHSANAVLFDRFGALLGTYTNAGGAHMALGQADADAAWELAGSYGYVVDLDTGAVELTFPGGAVTENVDVAFADADLNGVDELYVAQRWGGAVAWDVPSGLDLWSADPGNDYEDLIVADADDDGVVEVILGASQGAPAAYGIDPATGASLWSVVAPPGPIRLTGSTLVQVGDLDADGSPELWFATGATNSSLDHLVRGDVATGGVGYIHPGLNGPYVGPVRADLDGNGATELVLATREDDAVGPTNGYGTLLVFAGSTQDPVGQAAEMFDNRCLDGVVGMAAGNVDADAAHEVAVICERNGWGTLEVYGYAGGALVRDVQHIWNSSDPLAVGLADVDNNGVDDVVFATQLGMRAYSGGAQIWSSAITDARDLVGADLDADGDDDLAVLTSTGITVLDLQTPAVLGVIPISANHLRLEPAVSPPALLSASNAGAVVAHRYSAGSFVVLGSATVPGGLDTFDRLGPAQIAACQDGAWLSFNWSTGVETWRSADYACSASGHAVVHRPGQLRVGADLGMFGFTL
jgi:hypothetical protein